jgi:hypothetical protein
MDAELRQVLSVSYERMRRADDTPGEFAGNYALCLGMILGGHACGGISAEEAADERAHLMMLATLFEVRTRVRSDLSS